MKIIIALAASMAVLAACQPASGPAPDQPPVAPPATSADAATPSSGCNASASANWSAAGAPYNVSARADGPDCEKAIATLIIRSADGTPGYVWSGLTQELFGLSYATTQAEMTTALGEWIAPTGPETTGELPPWEETEGQPKRAEFPFMPVEWMDRQGYEALKGENAPMYCFPQGMESLQCIALRDGHFEDIGLQLFPG